MEAEAEAEAEAEEEVEEEDEEEDEEGTWEPVETPPEQIKGTWSFRAPAACGRTGGGHSHGTCGPSQGSRPPHGSMARAFAHFRPSGRTR